jgi:hypothetical protein
MGIPRTGRLKKPMPLAPAELETRLRVPRNPGLQGHAHNDNILYWSSSSHPNSYTTLLIMLAVLFPFSVLRNTHGHMQTHSCQVSQGRQLYQHQKKGINLRQKIVTASLHYFVFVRCSCCIWTSALWLVYLSGRRPQSRQRSSGLPKQILQWNRYVALEEIQFDRANIKQYNSITWYMCVWVEE